MVNQDVPEGYDGPDPREVAVHVTCPECDGEPQYQPNEALTVQERLQASGYLHNDIKLKCTECGSTWTHGVPRGQTEWFEDLDCAACGWEYVLIHRVRINHVAEDGRSAEVLLNYKCPKCYYFNSVHRRTDSSLCALVGYPQITGLIETEDVTPYGWEADEEGRPVIPGGGLTETPAED